VVCCGLGVHNTWFSAISAHLWLKRCEKRRLIARFFWRFFFSSDYKGGFIILAGFVAGFFFGWGSTRGKKEDYSCC
jgi:hypothetical protein